MHIFLPGHKHRRREEGGSKKLKPVLKNEKERKKRKKRNDGRRWKKIPGKKKGIRKTKEKKETTKAIRTTMEATKERKRKKEKKMKRKKEKRIKEERKERKKRKRKKKKKKKRKKKSTARGIPRRSPIQVLTSPDVAWLRWSDENRYFQRGMAVDITHSQTNSFILRNESKNAYTNSIIISACTPHLFLLA